MNVQPGMTLHGGRIRIGAHMGGVLWGGHLVRAPRSPVVIAIKSFPYAKAKRQLDELFRYHVPGIAPLAFLGYPDRGPRPRSAYELSALYRRNVWPNAALAEFRPKGLPLANVERLSYEEVLQLGIALCDTILTWAARREYLSIGIRPETVYVTGEPGHRVYSGATPRIAFLTGHSSFESPFSHDSFKPPNMCRQEISVDDAGFLVAWLLWFALLHENPYKQRDGEADYNNILYDRRRPFSGPPALGAVLEAVLVSDDKKRMSATQFREELRRLAAGHSR